MALNQPVTAGGAGAAEHDQVALEVVTRMTVDVMEGELIGLPTDGAITPANMQRSQKLRIADTRRRLHSICSCARFA